MNHRARNWLDAKQVSAILGWDIQKVWRHAREGRVPCLRIGRGFIFDAGEIGKLRRQLQRRAR